MTTPRTLLVTSYINRGGTSRVTVDLLRSLAGRGAKVALAITRRGEHAIGGNEPFPVFCFGFPKGPAFLWRFQGASIERLRRAWYRSILLRFRPEVVCCVDLDERVFDLVATSNGSVVSHIHAIHMDTLTRGLGYLGKLVSFADVYVTSSRAMAARLILCLGIPESRVKVYHNGVPVARLERSASEKGLRRSDLGLDEDEVVIVGSGAVNFVKGADLFVRAASSVVRRLVPRQRCRFLWIGETHAGASPFWTGCSRLVESLELGDRVRFLGYRDDVASIFSLADLFLVTSRAESIPLAMMEAMALATPVVAFPVGGVDEVLRLGGGVVLSKPDPEEAGRVVAQLIGNEREREAMGVEAARVIRNRFDSDMNAERFASILSHVVEAAPRGERRAT